MEGKIKIANEIIEAHNTVLFMHEGDSVAFENIGSDQAHLVFIAGKPIGRENNQISKMKVQYFDVFFPLL